MTQVLEVNGVAVRYGAVTVLQGVSFNVSVSSCHAIIGANGAGKTTLFRAITGRAPCTAGSIRVNGQEVRGMPAYRVARLGVSQTFQAAAPFGRLLVHEALCLGIQARERQALSWFAPVTRKVRREAWDRLGQFGLERLGVRRVDELSFGEQKAIEIALAMAAKPKLLLLDEPTAGMSVVETEAAVRMLEDILREASTSMVLVEHDTDVVFRLADAITVLDHGEVIAAGNVEAIRSNKKVAAVYLGED